MLDHDRAFLLEVMKVDTQTEHELDEQLKTEAKQLGVDIEETDSAMGSNQSFRTCCSDYSRRSESVDSTTSHSTGLMSTFSDSSKGHPGISVDRKGRSATTLSFKDYDSFVSRGVPNGRFSISFFSPPPPPLPSSPFHSVFSLPLSQPPASPDASPRRHFRRIRGLSLLRPHRSDSITSLADACPHCPHDPPSQRRAIHKLPCGHRLCTQALRNTINAAIDCTQGAVPSCCSQPIPGRLVEHVMTHEEQAALLHKLEQWDEAVSSRPSTNGSHREFYQHQPPGKHHVERDHPSVMPVSLQAAQEALGDVVEREDYRLLQSSQIEQRDRYIAWAAKQQAELIDRHDQRRRDLRSMHEAVAEAMQERHASATSDAEDKQVQAESDLREAQEKERCDIATALKHLGSYCAGTYSNGESHDRIVTEQARLELKKARWHQDTMAIRHESAINVLRGEQTRRLHNRALRQDRDLHELRRQQRKEELELERSCNGELAKLNESFDEKRRKLCWRQELQMAIIAKRIEAETGTQLECRLPTADWQWDLMDSRERADSRLDGAGGLSHHPRHDSTRSETDAVLHEPDAKYDRQSTGIMHVREFKIGGM